MAASMPPCVTNSAKINILEQPAVRSHFRYESEGRTGGLILGANSTPSKQTYPKIEIIGLTGAAEVIVSCVSYKPPYRQHPHKLVSKNSDSPIGVYILKVSEKQVKDSIELQSGKTKQSRITTEFKDMTILCMKNVDIIASLEQRKQLQHSDACNAGWDHMQTSQGIDLHRVRLCFQVIIEKKGKRWQLEPAISNTIMDKKTNRKLKICAISACTSPTIGGKYIILLCDKVKKDDIEVHFYEEDNQGNVIWNATLKHDKLNVHHQVAIAFQSPAYSENAIDEPRKTFVKLYRPSEGGDSSDPLPFEYTPSEQSIQMKRKRQKRLNDTVKPPLNCYANNFNFDEKVNGRNEFVQNITPEFGLNGNKTPAPQSYLKNEQANQQDVLVQFDPLNSPSRKNSTIPNAKLQHHYETNHHQLNRLNQYRCANEIENFQYQPVIQQRSNYALITETFASPSITHNPQHNFQQPQHQLQQQTTPFGWNDHQQRQYYQDQGANGSYGHGNDYSMSQFFANASGINGNNPINGIEHKVIVNNFDMSPDPNQIPKLQNLYPSQSVPNECSTSNTAMLLDLGTNWNTSEILMQIANSPDVLNVCDAAEKHQHAVLNEDLNIHGMTKSLEKLTAK